MIKFCKKCKSDTERNSGGRCKPCACAKDAAYRVANPDKERARQAAYRAANPEKARIRQAAWRAANPEKASAYSAAYGAVYRADNPEKLRIKNQNRHASKLTAGGKLSHGLSEKLFKLQRGKCACCKQPLGDDYHLDHNMPLALGGSNTDDNIQLLRQRCNNQKHTKHPIDFMQQRGFLL